MTQLTIILKNIYQNLHKLLLLLLQIYFLVLGFFWIILFTYFRLFTKRTSYDLQSLKYNIELKHYIGFILFILIHTILLSIVLYTLKKKEEKKTIIKDFLKKLQEILNYILWKPLNDVHEFIAEKIPGSSAHFLNVEKTWTTKNIDPKFFNYLIFIFNIFPRLVVAVIFFIDIVILGSFKYFIYALPLLIIPIIFNIYIKTFRSFAERNIPPLKEYFSEIKFVGNTYNNLGELIKTDSSAYEYYLKPEYNHAQDEFPDIIKTLFQLGCIIEYTTHIKDKIQKFTPYITLITSSIYLIGGLYRLFFFL